MTDIEQLIQLLTVELGLTVEKISTLADHLDPDDDDASGLFSALLAPINTRLSDIRKQFANEDIRGPMASLLEAVDSIYNLCGDECWSYKDSLHMVVAIQALLLVLEEK